MREELAGCVGLQHLLDSVPPCSGRCNTPPEELVALAPGARHRRESLGAKQAAPRGRCSAEQAIAQTDAEALREEREHFRKQKTHGHQHEAALSGGAASSTTSRCSSRARRTASSRSWKSSKRSRRHRRAAARKPPRSAHAASRPRPAGRPAIRTPPASCSRSSAEQREIQRPLGEPAWERFKKLWTSPQAAGRGAARRNLVLGVPRRAASRDRPERARRRDPADLRHLPPPALRPRAVRRPRMKGPSAVGWIDGGSRGNPGHAGCGIVIELSDGRRETHTLFLEPRPTTSPSTRRCSPCWNGPPPSGWPSSRSTPTPSCWSSS